MSYQIPRDFITDEVSDNLDSGIVELEGRDWQIQKERQMMRELRMGRWINAYSDI